MSTLSPRIDYYRASDGRRLAARVWVAVGPPRGRVVFLHGITSHGGWYDRSCRHLAEAGIEVHFLDRRGSGLNLDHRPGDVDRYETWLDDVAIYLDAVARSEERGARSERQEAGGREQGAGSGEIGRQGACLLAASLTTHVASPFPLPPSPFRPPVLCGISWGGKLAVAVARHRPHLVKALGLLCPGLYSPHEPSPLGRMLLAVPKPARLQQRRATIPLTPAMFTNSRGRRDYIACDPLSLREVTLRFARADRRLTHFARESAAFLHMPLMLMLSGRDRIVDNSRTRAFFGRTPTAHKTLVEYPNAAHTLEFEPDPLPYFRDLADWIGRVV
jgi:acylglycerol lipase